MSYTELRQTLIAMPPAGNHGFEGLVAALLSRLTGDRFFVARSGDQPADALSRSGVAIQAKRYDKTMLDETGFEGDYNKACRECPELDAYVLAATRDTAQLEVLSRQLEQSHGVDIYLVGFAGDRSPLAALCVAFWSILRGFISTAQLPAASDAWAASEAARPEVAKAIEELRTGLLHSTHTAKSTRRKLDEHRARRFGLDSTASWASRFVIRLPRFITRRSSLAALRAWWDHPSQRAAVLTAKEGMGKSWVAAAFAQECADGHEALVLWLDSADWAGQTRLRGLVEAGLRLAGVSEERVRERLAGKALRRWPHRLLIVLDGINERGAREAAHHLLAELFAADESPGRLLFTSRPINWASDEKSLWANTQTITLDRFTEDELCEALQRLPAPVARAELPNGLTDIAMIPRYFQRAVALRDRFQSFANVSKEMVLWADLLDKIAANDPQVAGAFAWTTEADARRALLQLAKGAQELRHADESERGYQMLLRVFGPEYKTVRQDLAEQRIVLDPAGDCPRPNFAHVRLGFALHLGRFLRKRAGQDISLLTDAIRLELEPLSSQDDVTEALFAALQLSVLAPGGGSALTREMRAALLLAWATAHNAQIEPARLRFWAGEDEAAYLDFLEALFAEPVSEVWMPGFLRPLSDLWRDAPDPASTLALRLRQWLKLVWNGAPACGSHLCDADGNQFPFAKSRVQLVLSRAALAVFSEAPPSEELLADFVLAWAADEFCLEEHIVPEREGQPAQQFMVRCKGLNQNLGAYFRWRCTERIKPALLALKDANAGNELISRACDEVTANFDDFGWRRTVCVEVELMNGASLFADTLQGKRGRLFGCAHLAVRGNLPPLRADDSAVIAEIMEGVFASPTFHAGPGMTEADLDAQQYLAWFARDHPQRLLELGTRFRLAALARAEEFGALEFANEMPYSPELASPRELLDAMKAAALRLVSGAARDHLWALKECHVLALTCLGLDELGEWFEFAARHKALRRELHCYPTPLLLPRLCPRQIANAALLRAADQAGIPAVPSNEPDSEFEFWADIAGRNCDPDGAANQGIAGQLASCPRGNWRRFHLLMIYFRSLSEEACGQAFASGELLRHLDLEGWRALRFSGRDNLPWKELPRNFEFVMDHAGLNIAGLLFAEAGQPDELRRWGEMLFAKASQLLDGPPPAREFWGRTIQFADAERRVNGSRCDGKDGPTVEAQPPLRPKRQASASPFSVDEAAWAQQEASANRAIQIWLEDVRRLANLPAGMLYEFQSAGALTAFRDLDPDRFRRLAMNLFEQVREAPAKAFHLGGFVHVAACVLMPLDPNYAAALAAELREGPFLSDVVNEHGVSISEAAAWAAAQAGDARCTSFCRTALESADSDARLMSHATTAQAEGAGPLLFSFCEELLGSSLAKERCLAVSVLPWLSDPDVPRRLAALAQGDPSGWVRAHAGWAVEVARQEAAAREHYRRVLSQKDAAAARTLLAVMRPALTPTAKWWRAVLESEVEAGCGCPEEVSAAISLFWDRINSLRKDPPELYGRKLGEYLRGEKISDIQSPAPKLH